MLLAHSLTTHVRCQTTLQLRYSLTQLLSSGLHHIRILCPAMHHEESSLIHWLGTTVEVLRTVTVSRCTCFRLSIVQYICGRTTQMKNCLRIFFATSATSIFLCNMM